MSAATVIVPTARGGSSLSRLLGSLHAQHTVLEVLVVANGVPDPPLRDIDSQSEPVRVIRLPQNLGYSRAVNLAARQARGDALVLLNDDCTCEPGYVEAIVSALDPGAGVTMAAGVMLDARDQSRIDTAGIEIGRGLLASDYLNGEPVAALDGSVPDPLGPSGAAAAFERGAFLAAGGFDENLFAYLEDVDLVLRMRLAGGRCSLASVARGIHEHSGTLGSGSAQKNYLMGFGRAYLLRKWGVTADPRRLATALAADVVICAGQVAFDRSLAGVRGRVRGYRAASPTQAYPGAVIDGQPRVPGLLADLRRRAMRRVRLARKVPGDASDARQSGRSLIMQR
jgi:N-acetylglucosaminyl-diphospho-decaprenol L-rhamnosyltransferase